jgi:hypothetical protein
MSTSSCSFDGPVGEDKLKGLIASSIFLKERKFVQDDNKNLD